MRTARCCAWSQLFIVALLTGCAGGGPSIGDDSSSSTSNGGTVNTGGATSESSGGQIGIDVNGVGGTGASGGDATAGASNASSHCGDSTLDSDEGCDDGNTLSGDGCDGTCKVEYGYVCTTAGQACVSVLFCGDGLAGPDESCDDGNSSSGDGCSAACAVEFGFTCSGFGVACTPTTADPVCGNGATESGETCDDGNTKSVDGCSSTCQTETGYTCNGTVCTPDTTCGNGILNSGEQCDDGNLAPGDCCNGLCKLESNCQCTNRAVGDTGVGQICASTIVCGDGTVTGDEACDDGGTSGLNGCAADCSKVTAGYTCPATGGACSVAVVLCPNAQIDPGEGCDDGNTDPLDGCSPTCKLESGYVCPEPGTPCRLKEYCGNGSISFTMGETCDDGNAKDGDGCSSTCTIETGFVCTVGTTGKSSCTKEVCGNGTIAATETCEDGNTVAGDGCSSCTIDTGYTCPIIGSPCRPICGDGLTLGTEQCDDGNLKDKDGCNSRCQLEAGFVCTGTVCRPTVCGDGVREGTEQCDVTNTLSGAIDLPFDGCYKCKSDPVCSSGVCVAACGDGQRFDSEECDDGNTYDGDGCSSKCKVETGFTCTDATTTVATSITTPVLLRDFVGSGRALGTMTTHPDFNTGGACIKMGIVQPTLDTAGRPAAVCGDATCSNNPGKSCVPSFGTYGNAKFAKWYRDDSGVNVPLVKELTLTTSDNGVTYQYDSAATSTGIFDLIGSGGWVALGKESLASSCANTPNVSFTSETHFWFEYQGGEHFVFSGDDDTWVFVNNHLVIDLGGVHGRRQAYFTLDADTDGVGSDTADGTAVWASPDNNCSWCGDGVYPTTEQPVTTLGLTVGGTYEVVVFQAERNQCESNFGITMSNFGKPKSSCKSTCGDGIVAFDEECDLGTTLNTGAYGGCKADCTLAPYCGDKIVDTADNETCDDGKNTNVYGPATSGCGLGCQAAPYCGDLAVDAAFGETCDAATTTAYGANGCTASCTTAPFCGDGIPDSGEACDDGQNNGTPTSNCDTKCAIKCGNGTLDAGEECDEGTAKNNSSYGGCQSNCTLAPYCGDGIKQTGAGETCDDGLNDGSYGTCTPDCQVASYCGDGTVNTEAGEECEPSKPNPANPYGVGFCTTSCQNAPYCGDSSVDSSLGEICDDGASNSNTVAGACKADCSGYNTPLVTCGNGTLDSGEVCDNGSANGTVGNSCDGRCQLKCGNGIKDSGEACDNGVNDGSYGTCNNDCTLTAHCGDGIKNGSEQCDLGTGDDGNSSSSTLYGKGLCTNLCQNAPYCGDLRVNGDEECDGQVNCTTGCTLTVLQ